MLLKVGGIFCALPEGFAACHTAAHLEKPEKSVLLSWENILYWFGSKHFTELLQQSRTKGSMADRGHSVTEQHHIWEHAGFVSLLDSLLESWMNGARKLPLPAQFSCRL